MLLIWIVDCRCFLSGIALLCWIIHLLLLPLTLIRVIDGLLSVLSGDWLVDDDCLVSGLLSWGIVASTAFFAQVAAAKAHQKLTQTVTSICRNILLFEHFSGILMLTIVKTHLGRLSLLSFCDVNCNLVGKYEKLVNFIGEVFLGDSLLSLISLDLFTVCGL